MPKPIIHGRDHAPGGADPIPFTLGIDTFALTGGPFTINNNPVLLQNAGNHFYTAASGTFDMSSAGLARIKRPGFYLIGLHVNVQTLATLGADTTVESQLAYGGGAGYSIEIPWFGFPPMSTEEIKGTRHVYPSGTGSGEDVGLQRLHPVSLTGATTFPLEIQPSIYSSDSASHLRVGWLGLWGLRVGDPLDSYHSD